MTRYEVLKSWQEEFKDVLSNQTPLKSIPLPDGIPTMQGGVAGGSFPEDHPLFEILQSSYILPGWSIDMDLTVAQAADDLVWEIAYCDWNGGEESPDDFARAIEEEREAEWIKESK